jgi:hypothetical protein
MINRETISIEPLTLLGAGTYYVSIELDSGEKINLPLIIE